MLADGYSFFQALGFALLNSVWVFGVVVLLFNLLTEKGTLGSPTTRYQLALGLMGAGLLLTIATGIVAFQDSGILYRYILSDTRLELLGLSQPWLPNIFPYLAFAYLLTLPFEGFRRWRNSGIAQLQDTSLPIEPMMLYKIKELSGKMGLSRKISFAFSAHIHSPLTYGFWRPVIVFPVALVNHLSLAQTEALLLHELVHIRNNDYLVHLVVQGTETLFFFNPFVKKMIRAISLEQELRSDDRVMDLTSDKIAYAEALYQVGAYNGDAQLPFALKASGDEKWLLFRISRIAGRNVPAQTKKTPAAQAVLGLASLLFCSLALLPLHQPTVLPTALASTVTNSSPIQPRVQQRIEKLSIARSVKVKSSYPIRAVMKPMTPPLPPTLPAHFAAQQPDVVEKEGSQPYIATGNLREQRAFTLEVSNFSNGNDKENTPEVRMEPFLPGNSFYYSKAEEEVKLFLANYANWLRDLRKALAIASQQNEKRKIDFLTKRIRHIETRKMRLDALRTIANPSDSSRKVVSF